MGDFVHGTVRGLMGGWVIVATAIIAALGCPRTDEAPTGTEDDVADQEGRAGESPSPAGTTGQ